MSNRGNIQEAIAMARAGRELIAREMFLDIVEADPCNELAWIWLIGLLDTLDDRIYACKKVLALNPANTDVRQYLAPLLEKKEKELESKRLRAKKLVQQARELSKADRIEDALALLRNITQGEGACPEAWKTLAELSPLIDEQVIALENLVKLTPQDANAQQELERSRYYQANPLEMAVMYEEEGKLDKAIAEYSRAAFHPGTKDRWNAIRRRVTRLESLQLEKITHIPPVISIVRLTAGPPLLYLMFTLVQVGLRPFANPEPLLWLGFLWVLLGGFMIALASVHSPERLKFILSERFGVKIIPIARSAMLIGWFLVLLPHVMMIVIAFRRLMDFVMFYVSSQ